MMQPQQDKWARLAERRRELQDLKLTVPIADLVIESRSTNKRQSEVSRVVGMPRYESREWDEASVRKRAGVSLRPVQRQALAAIADAGGALLPIGVGHGKTFIGLLSGAALGASLVIVLVPPRCVRQTCDALATIDSHFTIPKTEVVSYSKLSLASGSDLLDRLVSGHAPARVVLVADEAHNLKNFGAARTKRVARFLRDHAGVRFVAMSGTLSSRSIRDFAHLAEWALGEGSPLPCPSTGGGKLALDHWAAGIDVDGQPSLGDWDWCRPLWQWAGNQEHILQVPTKTRRENLRHALYQRMATTRGVTLTDQSAFGASLYVEPLTFAVPADLAAVMAQVERTKCAPDGVPIDSPVEQWRILRQLSLGFFYRWVWPHGPDVEWLAARSEWARQVRTQLDHHSAEGYDSPLLVYNRVAKEHKEGQRRAIHRAWQAWTAVKHRPAPPVAPVWVSTAVLDKCFAAVQNEPPTLIWYAEEAVADALQQRGLVVVRAGQPVPSKVQTCAVSIKSHGTGLNLQGWAHNLVLSPSGSGQEWEQMIGRTHRPGQTQDEVWVTVLHHTKAFAQALEKAKANAEYLQHTTGQPQKLLLATYL